jgi:transcriptional regulator with XRE-family HTH domain
MQKDRARRLADTLAGFRKRQRISQRELGELSGLSRAIISILERAYDPSTGQPPNPRPDTLRRLAHGLAIDGEGTHDPGAEERYYLHLMVAAGHLSESFIPPPPSPSPPDIEVPPGWTLRDALRGVIPEADLDEQVAYWERFPIENQYAAVAGILRAAYLAREARTLKPRHDQTA